MAILKSNAAECTPQVDPPGQDKVVDFSYTSESLAEMIVKAWTDEEFADDLLEKEKAKGLLAERGFVLENPVVITEAQYRNHHRQDNDNEIVFVLPDRERVTLSAPPEKLLETARLLMAIIPNGI
jgi:hypothetical protein